MLLLYIAQVWTSAASSCRRVASSEFSWKHSQEPTVISFRDQREGSNAAAALPHWNQDEVVKRFGNLILQTTARRAYVTVADYLQEPQAQPKFEQLFSPSDGVAPLMDAVLDEIKTGLPSALASVDARRIASVGRHATGSLLHNHAASWLFLAEGKKEWHLLPKSSVRARLFQKTDPCQLRENFPDEEWTTCTQYAGEVVYLPAFIWHATCNFCDVDSRKMVALGAGAQGLANEDDSLLYAARDGDVSSVRKSCAQSSIVDERSQRDSESRGLARTALHFAASHDRLEVAELLVSRGCGGSWMIRAPAGPAGNYPIHDAARYGSVRIVEFFLHRDHALVHEGSQKVGLTPLHVAAHYGQVGVAEVLLSAGARIEAATVTGVTAAHRAAEASQVKLLWLLLSWRADPTAKDKLGHAPMHMAMEGGHQEVITLLLSLPSPVRQQQLSLLAETPRDRRKKWKESVVHALLNASTKLGAAAVVAAGREGRLPPGIGG